MAMITGTNKGNTLTDNSSGNLSTIYGLGWQRHICLLADN